MEVNLPKIAITTHIIIHYMCILSFNSCLQILPRSKVVISSDILTGEKKQILIHVHGGRIEMGLRSCQSRQILYFLDKEKINVWEFERTKKQILSAHLVKKVTQSLGLE